MIVEEEIVALFLQIEPYEDHCSDQDNQSL
jgi:hypothetical protein